MSIVRIALRICAVEALKGQTLVGDNVLDSEIGALDVDADGSLRTDKDRPFISVYADDSKVLSGLQLRALGGSGNVDLIFEAGIASPHITTDPNTDEQIILEGVPATDANFEFRLDLTMRQISDALASPDNEWAEIFRSLVRTYQKSERARVSGDTQGVRLAAHQLKLTVEAVAEPVRGSALSAASPLTSFFAKCEADLVQRQPDMRPKLALMKAQIEGSDDELAAARRRFGIIYDEADALLLTPVGA